MGIKYYMQFLLQEAGDGPCQYSGVVEVDRAIPYPCGLEELEAMLADNFEVDCEDVKVIHWSRLH